MDGATGKMGRRCCRSERGEICSLSLPVIFPDVVLLRLETGTAAKIFFTGKTDFFLVDLVRRVLAFPSGWLLVGEIDVNLLVSLGGCLRLAVPIGGGKDAEGHGDTSFKVQIGDFCLARESSQQPSVTSTKG